MKANDLTAKSVLLPVIYQLTSNNTALLLIGSGVRTSFYWLCLLASAFSFSSYGAERYLGDWFETEVILFSQLDNKTKLKETFNATEPLASFDKSMDLLSHYLNPDIAGLKAHLPACPPSPANVSGKQHDGQLYSDISALFDISDALPSYRDLSLTSTLDSKMLDLALADTERSLVQQQPLFSEPQQQNQPIARQLQNQSEQSQDQQNTPLRSAPVLWPYSNLPLFPKTLCALNKAEFESFAVDQQRFSYNGFAVNTMPLTINAADDSHKTTPYLLNADSLQLTKITGQLRRSKNFRPLLHMAWRQQVFDLKRSIPLKVFAGDNLEIEYLDALSVYHQQQQNQQNIDDEYGHNSANTAVSSAKQQLRAAKQRHIANIAEQIDQVTNPDQVLAEIGQPITLTKTDSTIDQLSLSPPLITQPWTIDGFIKLHIFNNYLNITTGFNFFDGDQVAPTKPANEITGIIKAEQQAQPIVMQQERRVISSEIHYFDHPYIGMIIQIRRYQPPKPIIEADVIVNNR